MVTANLVFSASGASLASLSRELYTAVFDSPPDEVQDEFYVSVQLPSYSRHAKTYVVQCEVDEQLEGQIVQLPSKIEDVSLDTPLIDLCQVEAVRERPPVLESVTIEVHGSLYEELTKLSEEDQLKFLQIRGDLRDRGTVVRAGQKLFVPWCQILDCVPCYQGVIDLQRTRILLLKGTDAIESQHLRNGLEGLKLQPNDGPAKELRISLQCLERPIERALLTPAPDTEDDDSLFVFAAAEVLLRLGVTSGARVTLSDGRISRIAKVFVLLSPNYFDPHAIYATPRLVVNFAESDEVVVSKYEGEMAELPVASSVSISRVGSWENSQMVFQKIILNNLTNFITAKERIFYKDDLVPVTFDSDFSAMFSDQLNEFSVDYHDDSIVWFKFDTVKLNDEVLCDGAFRIDSKVTKLVTCNVSSSPPPPLSKCDYVSYYGLEPCFKYDRGVFDYAKRFHDIITTSRKCFQHGMNVGTTVILHSSSVSVGKTTLVRSTCRELGIHLIEIDLLQLDPHMNSSNSTVNIVALIRAKIENVLPHTAPSIVYLAHLEGILEKEDQISDPASLKAAKSMGIELAKLFTDYTQLYPGTVFVCSTDALDVVPEAIRSKTKFEIEVPVPTENQRAEIFRWYLSPDVLNFNASHRFAMDHDVTISRLALQSAGLTPIDIRSIVESAKVCCYQRSREEQQILWQGGYRYINSTDLGAAINKARDEFSDSIGAPKIPNVFWEDIGGLEMVKGEILDTIDMPLKFPELFASGMKKRSGILFYGPPGTGKTLLAKAVATNFSLNFFSVKGPELLNMYIGESEANVRRVFQRARDAKPCVIFFDELDSVAPKRGNQGDSGGVMDRIVSQLLAELDGLSTGGDGLFVIGATNRPDLLDEALLRPGRFDKLLYLGISDTNEKQANILRALTRKFALDPDVSLEDLAASCPFTYTGADFYALCSDAMLNAMTRIASNVDEKVASYNRAHNKNCSVRQWFDTVATPEDTTITVCMQDFTKAQRELVPSVSEGELNHYLAIRDNFESS
ncbi:AaceriAGR394Wp [[Ashbya] aceris (nom. inval.)]|nr:AaceriAGR394Wp [[Ashbya] aceris (nom. inval.)]